MTMQAARALLDRVTVQAMVRYQNAMSVLDVMTGRTRMKDLLAQTQFKNEEVSKQLAEVNRAVDEIVQASQRAREARQRMAIDRSEATYLNACKAENHEAELIKTLQPALQQFKDQYIRFNGDLFGYLAEHLNDTAKSARFSVLLVCVSVASSFTLPFILEPLRARRVVSYFQRQLDTAALHIAPSPTADDTSSAAKTDDDLRQHVGAVLAASGDAAANAKETAALLRGLLTRLDQLEAIAAAAPSPPPPRLTADIPPPTRLIEYQAIAHWLTAAACMSLACFALLRLPS